MKNSKTCCVCGEDAGRWEQWYNRDAGYGICPKCIEWLKSKGETEEKLVDLYGKPGIHRAA